MNLQLRISNECMTFIANEIDKYPEVETGGVFFGTFYEDFIKIEKVIDGGDKAIRERFQFRADKHYVDMQIDMIHANTHLRYIGEWHSHPQEIPFPSEQDLESLEEIAEDCNRPTLMMIFGFINFRIETMIEQSIVVLKAPGNHEFFSIPLIEE